MSPSRAGGADRQYCVYRDAGLCDSDAHQSGGGGPVAVAESLTSHGTILLSVLIFVIAALYSSVGQAGASGYIAAMALFGVAPDVMKPAALILNILVAALGTVRFYCAGMFSWRMPSPWSSAPFRWLTWAGQSSWTTRFTGKSSACSWCSSRTVFSFRQNGVAWRLYRQRWRFRSPSYAVQASVYSPV